MEAHHYQTTLEPRAQSKKYIGEYLANSITLFKDDHLFYREYLKFLHSLPTSGEYGLFIFDQLFNEYLMISDDRETSANLQEKCRNLFLLANVKV